jgi:hypothetical protein
MRGLSDGLRSKCSVFWSSSFPSHTRQGTTGLIPRNLAVLREEPALEVTRYLVELRPESVHVADNIGSLPSHAAIGRFESLDSVYSNWQVRVVKMPSTRAGLGEGQGLGRTLPSSCGCDVRCTPGGTGPTANQVA